MRNFRGGFVIGLLFFVSALYGQQSAPPVVVGDAISNKAVQEARDTLIRATPKLLNLQVNEFDILESASPDPMAWFKYLGGNEDEFIQRLYMQPGQSLTIFMKRRGEPKARLHELKGFKNPWTVVIGVQQGQVGWIVVKNNPDPKQPPIQVDTVIITTGEAPPDPDKPPPPTDEFFKRLSVAFQKDVAAGIGDKTWVKKLSGVYDSASRDNLESIRTFEDLDSLLYEAAKTSGIPDYNKALTSLRAAIRQEFFSTLSITENDRTTNLTADTRRTAKSLFSKLAVALGKLSQ